MSKNSNLHSAKKARNDEFYTQLSDIEKELKHYKSFFQGKKVLCNCNDDRWSSFFKYFSMNFEHLGLAKLTCVAFGGEDGHGTKYVFEGDTNGNRRVDDEEIKIETLEGNGDFRSLECRALLEEADVVVTNPPFSLFREFIALMQEYDKKFLVVGNVNAVTYKEIFPLIKENRLWSGVTLFCGKMPYFAVPKEFVSENDRVIVQEDGTILKQVNSIAWYTNIDHQKRNTPIDLYKTYNPTEFPKYDNYDAIECSKTADIPMDYAGVIGVPITFLDKYCPEQFEIIGLMSGAKGEGLTNGDDGRAKFYVNEKGVYARILIRHK